MENAIKKSKIFENLPPEETNEVIRKLSAGKRKFKKANTF